MRYILFIATVLGTAFGFSSCTKNFLEMPLTNTTTVDSVFSTWTKAQGAVYAVYRNALTQGLPASNDWELYNGFIQANLSGELTYGQGWWASQGIIANGFDANRRTQDLGGFANNFTSIRQAHLVRENIDKVTDISATEKATVKGEMLALIAYRYGQMLTIYGGVPIVSRSYTAAEEMNIPRSPVAAVVDSVVKWCDEAAAVLPSAWPVNLKGRMTKAAALAIKSKVLLYAARPLFNSNAPYLPFGANNNLIHLGGFDPTRWEKAAAAADAVITEAETNGGAFIINTGDPLDDYGRATSEPGNPEVLLPYKFVNTVSWTDNWSELPMNALYNPRYFWQATASVLTTNHLENFYKADGTNQTWPGINAKTPFADYLNRMNEMEARFKASFMPFQMNAWNNPGDANWNNTNVANGPGYGVARSVKFYYKAGSRRWFEFPIFRLAAAYLSAAEAYNEIGQTQKALERLNVVHQRAGLPAVTITDKDQLRAIIQREWAVEFHNENYRLQDVKHWKLPNIGNGILGGEIRGFGYNDNTSVKSTGNSNYNDRVIYTAYWSPKLFLTPFPQNEINKGIIVQNPGY